jgi:hypothetical protein
MQDLKTITVKLLFVALLLATAQTLGAQQITGEVNGTVTDSMGARISGATVVVTNSDTNKVVRTLHTNSDGIYSAPLLQVGNYSITASSTGFEPTTIDHIEVDVSASLKIDLSLAAGQATETVQVTASNNLAPDLENGSVSSVITGAEIENLALNTRNFEQLVQLQPGVVYSGDTDQVYTGRVTPSGTTSSSALSINGLRPDQNAWLLDGADMLAHNDGSQVVIFPAVESIGQMKVLRNSYGAQYGGGGNAQIEVITKAGTSAYHGELHMFARNAIFNANYYFANLAGEARPPDSEYTGGLSIGGPLFIPHLGSKAAWNTFFFYSLEMRRDDVGLLGSSTDVPSQQELLGNFTQSQGVADTYVCQYASTTSKNSACVPTQHLTNIDATALQYIQDVFTKIGAPNNPLDPNGIIQTKIGIHSENEQMIRLDHSFGPRFSTFFRFIHDPIYFYTPNGYGLSRGYQGVSDSAIHTHGNAYMLHGTYAMSSATVLDASISYEPFDLHVRPAGALANAPHVQVTPPFNSTLGHVPNIEFQGGADSYSTVGPVDDVNENFQAFVNLFHIIGHHSLSMGGNWELYREEMNQGTNNAGLFNFENGNSGNPCTVAGAPTPCVQGTGFLKALNSFLEGRVNFFQQSSIDPVSNASITLAEGYIQDDWKALPRLTLNGGVRYSFFQQPHEAGHHLGSFEPRYFNPALAPTIDNTGSLCLSGSPGSCAGGGSPNLSYKANNGFITGGVDSPYGPAVNTQPTLNFSPRIGFAWDIYGNGKTSLKGGYGIYYSESQLNLVHNSVFNNPFYVQEVVYNTPPSFASPGTNSVSAPLSAFGLAEHWHTPYDQGYSLELQQEFPGQTLIDIAYSGNVSRHLAGQVDINQPYPGEFVTAGVLGGSPAPCKSVTNGICTITTVNSTNTPLLNLIRPYQGYGSIIVEVPEFMGNYNALQTTLSKRLGPASRLSIAYSWSKGMTNNTSATGAAPQNSYNPSAEYGPTNFNRRHVFVAHYVYSLPFYKHQRGWKGHALGGWSTAAIVTIASGLDLTPTAGTVDPSGQGLFGANTPETQRPDLLNPHPNADAPHNIHSTIYNTAMAFQGTGYWFNPNDFAYVPVPTCPVNQIQVCAGEALPGNSRVGVIRGPGYQVWNLDVFKNITTSDHTHLQLRVEAFNIWNHPNWAQINTYDTGPTFGEITSDRDPRQMQLGARFFF